MTWLVLGLLIFLGVHSLGLLAPRWRLRTMERLGSGLWTGVFALASLLGLALVAWGFDAAREQPVMLWMPPDALRHVAATLTLLAFMLLAAAFVPGNHLKARLHHPLLLGVKTWAVAHLLVTGMLVHWVLFGSFLLWATLSYRVLRKRDRAAGLADTAGATGPTAVMLVLGVAAWAVFAFGLHGLLIGIKPFG